MGMWSELTEQPLAVSRLLEVNAAQSKELARVFDGGNHVVIAARGTSDNAARYAQYVWGARLGLSVGLAAPSLFSGQVPSLSLSGAVVVGISQSGQSPDLVAVLEAAKRQGRPTVVITNHPASPLGQLGDIVIDLAAGEERAVAATKTYTAQLAAVALLSAATDDSALLALNSVPETLEAVLCQNDGPELPVAGLAGSNRCVVVGRGFHQATVCEWALKLQELTYMLAHAFSAADFLHGPVALVEPGLAALLVATQGPHLRPLGELARLMLDREAHVVALTDDSSFPCSRRIALPKVDDWLSPLVAAPAMQMFAHNLAVARGLNPDEPRGLSKVTRTR